MLLFLSATVGSARSEIQTQQFVHESWTANDGLPVNGTTDLIQSRDGYLWLATFDGLVRFDGVRFTVYNTANSDGLPSNRIVEVREAPDGSLWMLTDQGHVARMRDGQFKSWGLQHGVDDWVTASLHIDPEGDVWVATNQGIRRLEDDSFILYEPQLLPSGIFAKVYRTRGGTVWAAGDSEVFRIHDGELTRFSWSDLPSGGRATDFYEDEAGAVWIATTSGVSRYRDGEMSAVVGLGKYAGPTYFYGARVTDTVWVMSGFRVASCRGDEYSYVDSGGQTVLKNAIDEDREGRVCFAIGNRIYQDNVAIYELPIESDRDGGVAALLHDPEGSVWLATRRGGLHRLKQATFTTYSKPEGLNHKNVYPVIQDHRGDMWFGTWGGGIARLANDEISVVTGAGFLSAFFEDSKGRMWFGGINSLGYFENGEVTDIEFLGAVEYADIYAILEDAAGDMWVGSDQGLFRYNGVNWHRYTDADGIPPGYVRVINRLSDGSLWMATNTSGLLRYRNGRFANVTTEQGLSSDLIRSLYEDTDGVLWVGTEGRGLCRIEGWNDDLSDISVSVIGQRDGLFDDGINQILEDDFGRLWMSSNRGIFWVPREMLSAFANGTVSQVLSTSYGERDGMRSRETNGGVSPAGVKAADGRLWFPTQDGVVVVDPSTIHRNEIPPPVKIEGSTSANAAIKVIDGMMVLSAGQRDFEVEYTALSFIAPENMRFRYRLEGYNNDWVDAGTRRVAYYTNVPPGDYRFRVIASNNDGVWNEQGAAIALSIAPFFYETTWFYTSAGFSFIVLGALGYKRRTQRLKSRAHELTTMVTARTRELESALETVEAQAEKLKTLDEAKSSFFANISHEFRTPLTLTIGPIEDLVSGVHGHLDDDATEQLDLALRNARRLLRLVNQILDVAKLEAGQMRLRAQQNDIVTFSKGVTLAFVPLAERQQIDFEFDEPDAPVTVFFDPDLLEKILTNLLSNAFKFTPQGGTVRLVIDPGQDSVDLIVADDGAGIGASELPHIFERFYQASESQLQASTGIGLSLARELVELHGGRINVSSDEGSGARFTVTLLRGTAHLEPSDIVESSPNQAGVIVEEARVATSGPGVLENHATGEQVVLVVDDNSEIREYVRRILEPSYRVMAAADGELGLAIAREVTPDLIVSDIMMPNMDGHALYAALKADPELDFIPVILLTAKATLDDKIAGLEAGVDDYLTKPFDRNELVARVSNLIASRQRLRERLAQQARPSVHAAPVNVSSTDEAFLEQVRDVIEEGMPDENFTVDKLAERLAMSRGHAHRRLRELLDETPTDLIRRIRLERAAQLLAGRSGSVSEVAYAVGFKSVSHFSRSFRDHFEMTPSQHLKNAKQTNS